MDVKSIKEFVTKNIAKGIDGYYMYRPAKAAGNIEYWMRIGPFPASQIMGIKKKGFKLWMDLTDEQKAMVNIFPDERGTLNADHMNQIKRQTREEAELEAELIRKRVSKIDENSMGSAISQGILEGLKAMKEVEKEEKKTKKEKKEKTEENE